MWPPSAHQSLLLLVPAAAGVAVLALIARRCARPLYDQPRSAATAAAPDAASSPSRHGSATDQCQPCEDEPPVPSAPLPASHTPRKALLGSPLDIGLSKDSDATTRRENYIEWHDYFMSVAVRERRSRTRA